MSPTLRRQKLEAAKDALDCAAANLLAAIEPAGTRSNQLSPDTMLSTAMGAVEDARTFVRWSMTLAGLERPCRCGDPSKPGTHGPILCNVPALSDV